MIAKKGKGNHIRDLCTINLVEANFNFNNKIMAKQSLTVLKEMGSFQWSNIVVGPAIVPFIK